MMFVPVGSKSRVSSVDVSLQRLECHLLCEPIHLICRVRSRPIHGLFERVHGLGGQLNVAMAGFTVFQLLDIVRLQSETVRDQKAAEDR